MEQGVRLSTSRGTYRLTVVETASAPGGLVAATLSLAHQGGLEKFALRCRLGGIMGQEPEPAPAAIAERLAPSLEKHFEQLREAALKSIRAERKLLELSFDPDSSNPFA